ncbi:MAG: translocation/assembly module TamB domain-containing protein, partial [Gammaproteobacteria bacterium]|nr:translocation/assembly module TamB domain-containing protein [Gammaproteobacteria bacterium]
MRRRLALWVGVPAVVLALLVVAAGVALHAPGGLRWAFDRLAPAVPGELSATTVDGPLAGPWRITGLHYRDGQGLEIGLDSLTLSWRPLALLTGQVRLGHLHGSTLEVRLPEAGDDATATEAGASLPRLPLRVAIDRLRFEDLTLRSGTSSPVRIASVTLAGGSASPVGGVRARSLEVVAPEGRLRLGGRVDPWRGFAHVIEGDARAELPGRPEVTATFTLEGDRDTTRVSVEADGPARAQLQGTVTSLLGDLAWQGRLQAHAGDLSRLDSALPAWPTELTFDGQGTPSRFSGSVAAALEHPEYGRLAADGTVEGGASRVDVAQLTVRAGDPAMRLRLASGSVELGDGPPRITASGSWQGLRWPLAGPAQATSPSGQFELDGTASSYRFDLAARLESPGLPPVDLNAAGEGGTTRARFDTLALVVAGGGGRVDGTGEVAWQPEMRVDLRGGFEGVDPGRFAEDWPGRLDGRFSVAGRLADDGPRWEAALTNLGGRLRGHPVAASGEFSGRGERIDLRQVEVSAGSLDASLEGTAGTRLDLRWRLASEALDGLLGLAPGLEGAFAAQGSLEGPRDAPTVRFEAEAESLQQDRNAIRRVTASGRVGVGAGAPIEFTVAARGLSVAGREIARLDLDGEGKRAEHRLRLGIEAESQSVDLAVAGGLADDAWQGALTEGRVGLREWGALVLETPASLRIASDRMELAEHCWRRLEDGTRQPGELCGSGRWQADGDWRADLRLADLSLALFALALPEGVALDGELGGEARFSGGAKGVEGRGRLQLGPGRVDVTRLVGGGTPIAFTGGEAELVTGLEGTSGSFLLGLGEADRVAGEIALPGVVAGRAADASSAVEGEVRLTLERTDLLAALVPTLDFGPGRVAARLELDGTVDAPRFGGTATVDLETIDLPQYGVVLSDLELRARDEAGRALRVTGGVTSGEGRLDLDGRMAPDTEKGWEITLAVAGERFTAADLHELRLLVSPDLEMTLRGRDLALSGRVEVPEALVRPKFGGTSVRGTSADAVVVGEAATREPADPLSLDASLRLVLGEQVRFEGFGLAGRVTGALDIEQRPDDLPLAQGELRLVDGSFNRYGQDLRIDSGRVLYANSPLDNPGIDARAVREV